MIHELDGAVAVVTGGASGIGKACCELLARSGATAVVVDRQGQRPVDVTDGPALRAVAEEVRQAHGQIDVLINSAGVVTENHPVEQTTLEELRRNLDVNVAGTWLACQAFGPLLRDGRGAVVNLASQAALVSLPWQAAYSASKGAVAALTRSLAIEWAERGVRVNAVAPGFVVTPMTEEFFRNERLVAAVERRVPLGRVLQAEEVANVIVFLASPQASAVTGVVVPIDGGWTAGEPALPW